MSNYNKLARNVDQPIAGLLKDLKSRGMLEDTLVVFATEFGRGLTTGARRHRPGSSCTRVQLLACRCRSQGWHGARRQRRGWFDVAEDW